MLNFGGQCRINGCQQNISTFWASLGFNQQINHIHVKIQDLKYCVHMILYIQSNKGFCMEHIHAFKASMWACDYSWKYDDSVIVDVMFFISFLPSISQDFNVDSKSKSNKDTWFNILEEWHVLHIYLWSKVVCFVLSHWDLPNHGCFMLHSWYLKKALVRVHPSSNLFEITWSYDVKIMDCWIIFSMKTLKLKIALEFAGVVGKLSAKLKI